MKSERVRENARLEVEIRAAHQRTRETGGRNDCKVIWPATEFEHAWIASSASARSWGCVANRNGKSRRPAKGLTLYSNRGSQYSHMVTRSCLRAIRHDSIHEPQGRLLGHTDGTLLRVRSKMSLFIIGATAPERKQYQR